jgi:hypothetical protein
MRLNGTFYSIAYYSKKINFKENNYKIYNKELLTIIDYLK